MAKFIRLIGSPIFTAVIFSCVVCSSSLAANSSNKLDTRKLVKALTLEANESQKNEWAWPTESEAIKEAAGKEAPRKTMIKLLSTRLSRSGPVDGYIKSQLLGLLDKPLALEPREVMVLIESLPMLSPWPQPTQSETNLINRYNRKKVPENEKPAIRKMRERLEKQEKENENINRFTLAYHQAIYKATSAEGGFKTSVQVEMIVRLLQCGHPDAGKSIRQLKSLLEKTGKDKKVNPAMKNNLSQRMNKLTKKQKRTLLSTSLMADGMFKAHYTYSNISKRSLQSFRNILNGKTK